MSTTIEVIPISDISEMKSAVDKFSKENKNAEIKGVDLIEQNGTYSVKIVYSQKPNLLLS